MRALALAGLPLLWLGAVPALGQTAAGPPEVTVDLGVLNSLSDTGAAPQSPVKLRPPQDDHGAKPATHDAAARNPPSPPRKPEIKPKTQKAEAPPADDAAEGAKADERHDAALRKQQAADRKKAAADLRKKKEADRKKAVAERKQQQADRKKAAAEQRKQQEADRKKAAADRKQQEAERQRAEAEHAREAQSQPKPVPAEPSPPPKQADLAKKPAASPTPPLAPPPATAQQAPAPAKTGQVATVAPPVAPQPAPPPAATAAPPPTHAKPPAAKPAAIEKHGPPGMAAPSHVDFTAGTADLSPQARAELDAIAKSLTKDDERRLQLVAYATGANDEANQARRLSLSRALNVRAYLIDHGVRNTRMDVRALGNRLDGGQSVDRVDILFIDK